MKSCIATSFRAWSGSILFTGARVSGRQCKNKRINNMHIRITEQRRGTAYEVLCDVCGQAIDLDETCDYLTMKNGVCREANIAHRSCGRIPGRFTNHWTRMTKPRHIIQDIADHRPLAEALGKTALTPTEVVSPTSAATSRTANAE